MEGNGRNGEEELGRKTSIEPCGRLWNIREIEVWERRKEMVLMGPVGVRSHGNVRLSFGRKNIPDALPWEGHGNHGSSWNMVEAQAQPPVE